eukprot:Em0014g222a
MTTLTAVLTLAITCTCALLSGTRADSCDYQGAQKAYEELLSIISPGGQKGCCPKIVPQGGITGSLITSDTGYRGDVAIIVDWGTCTAQPAGGFLVICNFSLPTPFVHISGFPQKIGFPLIEGLPPGFFLIVRCLQVQSMTSDAATDEALRCWMEAVMTVACTTDDAPNMEKCIIGREACMVVTVNAMDTPTGSSWTTHYPWDQAIAPVQLFRPVSPPQVEMCLTGCPCTLTMSFYYPVTDHPMTIDWGQIVSTALPGQLDLHRPTVTPEHCILASVLTITQIASVGTRPTQRI